MKMMLRILILMQTFVLESDAVRRRPTNVLRDVSAIAGGTATPSTTGIDLIQLQRLLAGLPLRAHTDHMVSAQPAMCVPGAGLRIARRNV